MSAAAAAAKVVELAQAHPGLWARVASRGQWVAAPHLLHLSRRLVALARGDVQRLVVSMPPRHGKSQLCSRYLPGWWLGRHPQHHVLLATYAESLALTWSARTREDLAEWGLPVFGVRASAKAAAGSWDVLGPDGRRTGGGLLACGVGGPLTGRGGDLLIVDDSVKGAEDASSQAQRDKAWSWWQQVWATRAEPGARMLVIGTRWHEDDLIGRLLREQAESWEAVSLPALAEDDDPLGREPGEPLWPARYDREAFAELQRDLGSYAWSALYQGRPAPADGGLFRRAWLRHWEAAGDDLVIGDRRVRRCDLITFATVDLAVSTRETADFTVAQVWGAVPGSGELLLLHQVRRRMAAPELLPTLSELVREWGVSAIWVEATAFQLSVVQHLRAGGLPARELRPDRDKVARALPATAAMEAGLVYLPPERVAWVGELVRELLTFPLGAHDDQVDALAYGVQVGRSVSLTPPRPIGVRARPRRPASPLVGFREPEEDE